MNRGSLLLSLVLVASCTLDNDVIVGSNEPLLGEPSQDVSFHVEPWPIEPFAAEQCEMLCQLGIDRHREACPDCEPSDLAYCLDACANWGCPVICTWSTDETGCVALCPFSLEDPCLSCDTDAQARMGICYETGNDPFFCNEIELEPLLHCLTSCRQ